MWGGKLNQVFLCVARLRSCHRHVPSCTELHSQPWRRFLICFCRGAWNWPRVSICYSMSKDTSCIFTFIQQFVPVLESDWLSSYVPWIWLVEHHSNSWLSTVCVANLFKNKFIQEQNKRIIDSFTQPIHSNNSTQIWHLSWPKSVCNLMKI